MKVAGIGWNEIMVIVMAVGSTEAAQANPVGGRGKVQCSAVQRSPSACDCGWESRKYK